MKAYRPYNILILAIFAVITALAATQIPKIKIDSSTEVFIPDKHEIKQINDRIEKDFGSIDSIMMGIRTEIGTVTDEDVLQVIDGISGKLKQKELVSSVLSLTNMDYIRGTDEGIEVIPLYDSENSGSEEELNERLIEWQDAYYGTFISDNKKLATIIVQPINGADEIQVRGIYKDMVKLAEEYDNDNLDFHLAGFTVVKDELNRNLVSDVYWLIPSAVILILSILFISFRRWEAVLFPILCLLIAVVWISGVIGFFKIPFTMAGLLVPVLLLVVGSAYGIHMLSYFYVHLAEMKKVLTFSELHELVRECRKKVFLPVLLAGATTAGGFLSLLSSPLHPFRMFGVLSALGVVFTQIGALVLIPVMLELRYSKGADAVKQSGRKGQDSETDNQRTLIAVAHWVGKKHIAVPVISAAILLTTLSLIPKIQTGTDMLGFFGSKSTIRVDADVFDENLGGSDFINVSFKAPGEGDILNPDFLLTLEDFEQYMKEVFPFVSSVQSVVPSIKRINQVMNVNSVPYALEVQEEDSFGGFFGDDGIFGDDSFSDEQFSADSLQESIDTDSGVGFGFGGEDFADGTETDAAKLFWKAWVKAGRGAKLEEFIQELMKDENYNGLAYYEIPADPAKYGLEDKEGLEYLISQYLVLYSDSLKMMINDPIAPDKTLVTVRIKNATNTELKTIISSINRFWTEKIPEDWSYKLGGGAMLGHVLSNLVTRSQYISLLAALLIVLLIVAVMFRSLLAGLLALVPVMFALAGIFMFMVIGHFKLDIITSLLASLAIGIGIDYAIHFLSACKRQLAEHDSINLAYIYKTTGRAIFVNALSVAVGFSALLISNFIPIRQMGVLFMVSMVFACMASLMILPYLLLKIQPVFLFKQRQSGQGQDEEQIRA